MKYDEQPKELLFHEVLRNIFGVKPAVIGNILGITNIDASALIIGGRVFGRTHDWWSKPSGQEGKTRLEVLRELDNFAKYETIFNWYWERMPEDRGDVKTRATILVRGINGCYNSARALLWHCFGSFHENIRIQLNISTNYWYQNTQQVMSDPSFWLNAQGRLQGKSRLSIITDAIAEIEDKRKKYQALYYLQTFVLELRGTNKKLKPAQLEWRKAVGEVLGAAIKAHIGEHKYAAEIKKVSRQTGFESLSAVLDGTGSNKECMDIVNAVIDYYGWLGTYRAECNGTVPPLCRSGQHNPALAKTLSHLRTLTHGD